MTILEVVTEICSEPKPYVGKMPYHQLFFATVSRIRKGTAKPATIEAFFRKFGYEGSFNDWSKTIS